MKKKNEATKNQESKKAPVYSDKVGGLSASVFLNKTKEGKEFPSAVIERRYKAKDGTWKSTNSYGAKALKDLEKLASTVGNWMDSNYPDAAN